MLENLTLENLLLFDIETVPATDDYSALPAEYQSLWEHKIRKLIREDETPAENYFSNAGIYAEFGKIVCISAGFFKRAETGKKWLFKVKSFASDNEAELLTNFKELLDKYYNDPQRQGLCGHNIREFDVPFVCRRMLVNGIRLPNILDLSGKKPWEVLHVDTMQLWKFGDVKNFTSLRLLALLFNIPTPKDDIDGKDVGRVYWHEKNLARIVTYCQKDVITVAQLLLRYKGLPQLGDDEIVIINGV